VADDCYAVPFVNDTHLANDPRRDPDFDAGLPRSPFQQVFAWLVPNTAAHGGRDGQCRSGGARTAATGGPARATRRASRAATRVLRVTARRELRAIARRNAIVGPK